MDGATAPPALLIAALTLCALPRLAPLPAAPIPLQVSARVVSCDPAARKVVLTMKKQLLKTDLPAITCLDDAKAGTRAYGVVTGIKDYGVFVSFFGGVTGLIRTADLGLKPSEDPKVRAAALCPPATASLASPSTPESSHRRQR